MNVTKCEGNGQGSCKRCLDNGKWNRMWMRFLYQIEGYEGRYCSDCVKEILKENMNNELTIKSEERKPTGLLHSTDELKRLILGNPELPILVLAGDNANIGDYGYMSCSRVRAQEGEFLDCEQQIDACKCYTDRDDFEDDVADFLAGEEQYRDLPDDGFNFLVERTVNEYDDFWKPCILLHVDN